MADRKILIEVQKDGHINRIVTREKPLPEVGEYGRRVRFNRFGQGQRFDLTIRVTSPVVVNVMGAVAELEVSSD